MNLRIIIFFLIIATAINCSPELVKIQFKQDQSTLTTQLNQSLDSKQVSVLTTVNNFDRNLNTDISIMIVHNKKISEPELDQLFNQSINVTKNNILNFNQFNMLKFVYMNTQNGKNRTGFRSFTIKDL